MLARTIRVIGGVASLLAAATGGSQRPDRYERRIRATTSGQRRAHWVWRGWQLPRLDGFGRRILLQRVRRRDRFWRRSRAQRQPMAQSGGWVKADGRFAEHSDHPRHCLHSLTLGGEQQQRSRDKHRLRFHRRKSCVHGPELPVEWRECGLAAIHAGVYRHRNTNFHRVQEHRPLQRRSASRPGRCHCDGLKRNDDTRATSNRPFVSLSRN
jgi:hypothetical protein